MNGIPGTAMPAFAILPPDEVAALLEYVKYLSMRGQMETALVGYVVDNLDYDPATGEGTPLDLVNDPDQRDEIMALLIDDVIAKWQPDEEVVVIPDESAIPPSHRTPAELAASVKAGRELFYGTKANCVKCHGPTGLGDGQQDDYDIWSKAVKKFEDDTAALQASITADKQALAELKGEELSNAEKELQAKYRELKTRQQIADGLLPPRNAIPRNLRSEHVPRRPATAGFVPSHPPGDRGHTDAGRRTGGAGRPGNAHRARDVADRRLRAIAALRTGQPTADASD